ncbi:MAG: hypothetical protein QF449_15495 [Alphaproteobacteria bacterium]|jgi:hypothetical protein|nr:hypothetical protein [Alphaproteobacteria bacterium]MDP6819427.1 hypothetical protein [Alphaproteobacteria bacterium]
MPLTFIPLYATLALALSAFLLVPYVAIPALADSGETIRLGFLESIDDPSRLHVATAKLDVADSKIEMVAENDSDSHAWRRELGPVWVWNPEKATLVPSLIASR